MSDKQLPLPGLEPKRRKPTSLSKCPACGQHDREVAETLKLLHWGQKLSIPEIAHLYRVSEYIIHSAFSRAHIPQWTTHKKHDWSDLRQLYTLQGLSTNDIAQVKGCNKSAVKEALKRVGIKARTDSQAQLLRYRKHYNLLWGEKHPNWKGGRIRCGSKGRYIGIRVYPDSPFYCMADKRGYVQEHRLVLAQALSRPLLPTEKVHHINGDKHDNRRENLKLVSPIDHNIYTELCKQCPVRKEVRLLRWQIKELNAQIQGRLLPDGDKDHV